MLIITIFGIATQHFAIGNNQSMNVHSCIFVEGYSVGRVLGINA
jgi:hypothetical protein